VQNPEHVSVVGFGNSRSSTPEQLKSYPPHPRRTVGKKSVCPGCASGSLSQQSWMPPAGVGAWPGSLHTVFELVSGIVRL
jgi:hypothetical protein